MDDLPLKLAHTQQLDRTDSVALHVDRIPIKHFDLRRVEKRSFSLFSTFAVLFQIELQDSKRVILRSATRVNFQETNRTIANGIDAPAPFSLV